MNLAGKIKQKALQLGFDLVGITDASPIDAEQVKLLADWLTCGFAGKMSYMHRNFEKRIDPRKLLDGAKSIICVGLNYCPAQTEEQPANSTAPTGRVVDYAQYEDYHPFMKKRLRKLAVFIASAVGAGLQLKICVDSAPLIERALAVRAGLGFIGKNHMLTNPELGQQIFLGELITNLELQTDKPIVDKCPNCDKCITACPTGALLPDGRFDANKCINYLTIEYKGLILSDLAKKISDRIFGCDECVLACPHRDKAPACKNKRFNFYADRAKLDLQRILNLSNEQFETDFAGSVFMRLGLDRLKRNAQICLDNIIHHSI